MPDRHCHIDRRGICHFPAEGPGRSPSSRASLLYPFPRSAGGPDGFPAATNPNDDCHPVAILLAIGPSAPKPNISRYAGIAQVSPRIVMPPRTQNAKCSIWKSANSCKVATRIGNSSQSDQRFLVGAERPHKSSVARNLVRAPTLQNRVTGYCAQKSLQQT